MRIKFQNKDLHFHGFRQGLTEKPSEAVPDSLSLSIQTTSSSL